MESDALEVGMSLHATRGWGYGPLRDDQADLPLPRLSANKIRQIAFEARQQEVLKLIHAKPTTAADLMGIGGWCKASVYRALNFLIDTGQIEFASVGRGPCVFRLPGLGA